MRTTGLLAILAAVGFSGPSVAGEPPPVIQVGPYQITAAVADGQPSGAEMSTAMEDEHAPRSQQSNQQSGTLDIRDQDKDSLLHLRFSAVSRRDGDETVIPLGVELTYGSLYKKSSPDHYQGFYRLTGKFDTDSTLRLNASTGYTFPGFDGEFLTSYRLLNSKMREDLELAGEYTQKATEQGLVFQYRQHLNWFVKSVGATLAYTDMAGDSENITVNKETSDTWSRTSLTTGFGGVRTVGTNMDVAMGYEGWQNSFVQGLRLDLTMGYEEIRYEAFQDIPEEKINGLTASAVLALKTGAGQLSAEYRTGEAADSMSLSYGTGKVSLYARELDYHNGRDETIFGLNLSGTLADLADPVGYLSSLFTSSDSLFPERSGGYEDIAATSHYQQFASDQFKAKPRISERRTDALIVMKSGLPANVQLDQSTGTLVVHTVTSLQSLLSVSPSSAASAFSVSGNAMAIALDRLPRANQSITAKALESGGAETWVTLHTRVGSLIIDAVTVRQGVSSQNPVPEEPESIPSPSPAADDEPPVEDPPPVDDPEPAENQPPVAVMNLHYYSTDGLEIGLYGTQSYDPEDGAVSSYSWSTTGDCWAEPHWFLPGPGVRTVKKTTSDVVCVVTLEVCDSEGLCGDKTYTW